MPLSVILPDGTVTQPELGSGDPVDAFTQEITVAAEAIATGREAERLSGNLARQALTSLPGRNREREDTDADRAWLSRRVVGIVSVDRSQDASGFPDSGSAGGDALS